MIKKYICFQQTLNDTTAGTKNINFSALKWPVEFFTFGLRFMQNTDKWSMSDWDKFTYTTRSEVVRKDWQALNRYKQLFHQGNMTGESTIEDALALALVDATLIPQTGSWVVSPDYTPAGKDHCDIHMYEDESTYIQSALLRAQQIDIIKPQISKFFNSYVPFQKKGTI